MSDPHYFYKAFGLVFSSSLPFPELPPAAPPDDVEITMGVVPKGLPTALAKTSWYEANKEEFLLRIKDVAQYHIMAQGKKVTIQPAEGATDDNVRLFFLGNIIAAILHLKGSLPLHASAVEIEDHALLFMGPSRAGKSTMAATLHKQGHRVLTDDIAVITFDNSTGEPQVIPGYPQLKLWADTIETLQQEKDGLRRLMPNMDKFGLRLDQTFCESPKKIRGMYVLNPTDEGMNGSLEALKGMDKLNAILANTYRLCYVYGVNGQETHFHLSANLAERVPVFRLNRPADGSGADEMIML